VRKICLISTCAAALLAAMPIAAKADFVVSSPVLPPQGGEYAAQQVLQFDTTPIVYIFGGLHSNFINVHTDFTTSPGNELETFDSSFTGYMSIGSATGPFVPVHMTGPVAVTVLGRTSNTETGTFATVMTSLDMNGILGADTVEVILDPAETSTGQTTITPLAGGLYDISSYFFLHPELSLDGGPFVPLSNGQAPGGTAEYKLIPEPASLGLLGTALSVITLLRRRRRA
jgi:hypothetical protein